MNFKTFLLSRNSIISNYFDSNRNVLNILTQYTPNANLLKDTKINKHKIYSFTHSSIIFLKKINRESIVVVARKGKLKKKDFF